ncbi:DUF2812 domain-containing protein [Paenibacillus sp. NPDC058071]|uniref:DUF2812 domain-containing protein n=1 Tax=Paenibacillus sp. NPDC058071 TaxID=3346326 RepID=UPI0036DF32DF
MRTRKYVSSGGLAFSEKSDMRKLGKYARKGWVLESFAPFGYWLRKSEALEVVYEVDYCEKPDEEYYAIFEAAGWTHVCSAGESFHIFRAPTGTQPIYTDKASVIERYEREINVVGKAALPLLIAVLVFWPVREIGLSGWLPDWVNLVGWGLGFVALIGLIFTGMPYIAYQFKLRRSRV